MAARVERTVIACGREVRVIELTVGDIRAWLAGLSAPPADAGVDVVDQLLFEDVALAEIGRMTDLTADELADAAPSELAAILDCCREVNRHFFALRSRLMTAGTMAMDSMAAPPASAG